MFPSVNLIKDPVLNQDTNTCLYTNYSSGYLESFLSYIKVFIRTSLNITNQYDALQMKTFYSGNVQSDEEVLHHFVARDYTIDIVVQLLGRNVDTPSCQHGLIIGTSGQGKSLLLARTELELRFNHELSSHLFPVRFSEENHEIFNIGEFWLEAMFHLARECTRSEPEIAKELDDFHSSLSKKWNSDLLENHAFNAVMETAEKLGKRLVLMVENFESLLKNTPDIFGWQLRKVLQTVPEIILLTTSNTYFNQLIDSDEPFYGFFRVIQLDPLNTADCQNLWATVTKIRLTKKEIRPLEILSGRNPRLLMMMAQIAQNKSTSTLLDIMVLLMDKKANYFHLKIDSLPKMERRVFLAVIDLWQSSSSSEICVRARMDIRTVSTMLGRLVKRGFIVIHGIGRMRKYRVSDRLFPIYYRLSRTGDQSSDVLQMIHFMSAYYWSDENPMSRLLLDEITEIATTILATDSMMIEDAKMIDALSPVMIESMPMNLQQFLASILEDCENREFEQATIKLDFVQQSYYSEKSYDLELQYVRASILVLTIICQYELNHLKLAISTIKTLVASFQDSTSVILQRSIACSLQLMSIMLSSQGNSKSALSSINKSIDYFHSQNDPIAERWLIQSLIFKSKLELNEDRIEPASSTYVDIMQKLHPLDVKDKPVLMWEALILGVLIQLAKGEIEHAMDGFQNVYAEFNSDNPRYIKSLVYLSLALLRSGAQPQRILEIIDRDEHSRESLIPLIIVLKKKSNESFRAPQEILKIAYDIMYDSSLSE